MQLKLRDPLSGLTHFIGILMAIVALIVLVTRTNGEFTVWHAVSFSIFGAGMILLYTFSTLYHWLPLTGKKLELFRKIDHIMIFIFIAATYTPICLVSLRGGWGWSIFGCVWALAIAGFFMKVFTLKVPRILYTSVYVLMGWFIVIGLWPLSKVMDSAGLIWMFAGGLSYTFGAVIYAFKKPDPWPGVFGFHEIFHVFIMFGSFAHFWLIYKYV